LKFNGYKKELFQNFLYLTKNRSFLKCCCHKSFLQGCFTPGRREEEKMTINPQGRIQMIPVSPA
jgi:hypothetical protein